MPYIICNVCELRSRCLQERTRGRKLCVMFMEKSGKTVIQNRMGTKLLQKSCRI